MVRETKAAKAARIADLLAEYKRLVETKSKVERDLKSLSPQIRELAAGEYNDWVLSFGTPRKILDQPKARELLTTMGLDVPEVETKAPINVNPKVSGK